MVEKGHDNLIVEKLLSSTVGGGNSSSLIRGQCLRETNVLPFKFYLILN